MAVSHTTSGAPTDVKAVLDWRALAEAGLHDVKIDILRIMASVPVPEGDPGWSPKALAEIVGKPLGVVSYHVRLLADDTHNLIHLAATEPKRGALQHYYALNPGVTTNQHLVDEMIALAMRIMDPAVTIRSGIEAAEDLADMVLKVHVGRQ